MFLHFSIQIIDCLKRFDKSQEPVTSFPSKIEKIPEIPLDPESEQFGLPVAAGYSPSKDDKTIPDADIPVIFSLGMILCRRVPTKQMTNVW